MLHKFILFTITLLFTASSHAALVTYNFTGTVQSTNQSILNVGDTYSVNYTWDTATTSASNVYYALTSLTGAIGTQSLSGTDDLSLLPSGAGFIGITDGNTQDSIIFVNALNTLDNAKLGGVVDIGNFVIQLWGVVLPTKNRHG